MAAAAAIVARALRGPSWVRGSYLELEFGSRLRDLGSRGQQQLGIATENGKSINMHKYYVPIDDLSSWQQQQQQ